MEQRFFLFLLLLQAIRLPLDVSSSSTVEFLPGFQGPLPFELETGYVGVDESSDVQLFYYFIKSEGNAKEDPLLLWLTGGPGCSTLTGLFFEIGPLKFREEEYNGSIPTLVYNPHSWTKVSSIIFVDLPVGTGFSYARTSLALQSNDFILVRQANKFLRKWLLEHPEFLSHPVYIGGDSYSGITIPAIVQQISDGRNRQVYQTAYQSQGNPGTIASDVKNSRIPFAHRMGLISDELYKSLKTSCRGEYQSIDPRNTACLKYVQAFEECTSSLNKAHILERKCLLVSPKPIEIQYGGRRSLNDNSLEYLERDPSVPEFGCRSYAYLLCKYWANEISVRKALHVREGSIGEWVRCNDDLPYTNVIHNSVTYHAYLGTKGYRALIYSGDHDFLVPFVGTQTWIRSLNYSIVDDWRPWYLEGQVAGYTRTYSNQMTFATVKGAGHTAPEYKPRECLAMLTRWISEVPL